MTEADLNDLMKRGEEYVATREELQVIDEALASIDAGEAASCREIEAAFRKFRSRPRKA